MGSISIFNLQFSSVKFACSRDLVSGFRLQAGEYVMSLTLAVAEALAQGGARVRLKAQIAAHYGRELKPGATFRRDMLAVDGRTVHIELGVSDAGDSVYLEVGAGRMTLADQQASLLLAVLDRLGADVNALHRASETSGPDFGVAQGMRAAMDWRLPPWAREF
jgi:hypothetical protein